MDAARPKHFSMIRDFTAADVLTLGNGACGAASIFAMMQLTATGEPFFAWVAFVLLPLALVLDVADGRVARWRRRSSALGADLDSLADVISFGVAPAALAFALGMRTGLDEIVLLYFVCCGISRLARFNVTATQLDDGSGKVKYFEGTPIPSSVLLVVFLAVLFHLEKTGAHMLFGQWGEGPWAFHPLVLIFAASGSGMISKTLRIPKF